MRDLEVGHRPVGAVGVDEIPSVFLEEPRRDAVVLERRVVEIREHRLGGGDVHGEIVVRAHPLVVLLLVARDAARAWDEARPAGFAPAVLRQQQDHDDGGDRQDEPSPRPPAHDSEPEGDAPDEHEDVTRTTTGTRHLHMPGRVYRMLANRANVARHDLFPLWRRCRRADDPLR